VNPAGAVLLAIVVVSSVAAVLNLVFASLAFAKDPERRWAK
jgi:hypothetical protein